MSVVGLISLALVTVVVAAFALLQHRSTATVTAVPAATPTAERTVTESPSPTPSAASLSPSNEPSVSPTATETEASEPADEDTLALATEALDADGSSVLVFGDGSGNDEGEWVHAWASDHLAGSRAVEYVSWEKSDAAWRAAETMSSDGDAMTVWNASISAPPLDSEPSRVAAAWQDADVVLLNYGHRKSPSELKNAMPKLLEAIRAQDSAVPVVVVLQNPDPAASASEQREAVETVEAWATDEDLPTIDVFGGFPDEQSEINQLVMQDGSPNAEGSDLFAEIVADALTVR